MPKSKKEKNRRSKVKRPALQQKYTHRLRQETLDYDYLDKLSEAELDWLNKFTEEYQNAGFKQDGTDIDKTATGRKASYDRNNARNRCLYGHLKNKSDRVNNKKLLNYDNIINDIEDEFSRDVNPRNMENAYIDFIESKEVDAMMREYADAMAATDEKITQE